MASRRTGPSPAGRGSNNRPFRINDRKLLREYEGKTRRGLVATIRFSDESSDSPISVSYAKKSSCRALEALDARDIVAVNFESVRLSPKDTKDFIMKRIEFGLELPYGNSYRTFHFFGCSQSQLRRHVAILVRRSEQQIERMLDSMGDFTMDSVSKRTKRISLLFTDAKAWIGELDPARVGQIEDLTSRSGEVLTDGCGFVSKAFAKRISRSGQIAYRDQRYTPSVYQFRYMGYKGVVSLQPDMPRELSLQCRPSMRKFKGGNSTSFGLVEASKPYSFGALNAEHVTLLVELGIEPETLLKKQREYHEFLRSALSNPEEAFELLVYRDQFSIAEQLIKDGFNAVCDRVRKNVHEELDKGVNKRGETRVHTVLLNSRLLFGVAEPGSRLGESEVFVRITVNGLPHTLTDGWVLVTRNPCLHPGDFRFLKAVDIEEYHHLVDCIVFSASPRLEHPHAAEMSGGDLDGDKFMVIFDREITSCKMVFRPYEYPPAKLKPQGGITRKDMKQFFAKFNNSSLGRIKNTYLKWVAECGARCKEALELNALFSACVDGEHVSIPDKLLKVPEPTDASNEFIVSRLVAAAQSFIQELLSPGAIIASPTISHSLLESFIFEDCSQYISSFELFRLVQGCEALSNEKKAELSSGIDFQSFTFAERFLALKDHPQYGPMMHNALYQSELIPPSEFVAFGLMDLGNWKRLYSSTVPGPAFHDRLTPALCNFTRKLIVAKAGPHLTVVLFIDQKLDLGVNSLSGLHVHSTTCMGFRGHNLLKGFCLDLEDHLVQVYKSGKRNTFVWLATAVNHADKLNNFVGRISIDLRRLGNRADERFSLVRRAPVSKVEVYVLASEDSRDLQLRHYGIGDPTADGTPILAEACHLQCREYEVYTETDWLETDAALPDLAEMIRQGREIESSVDSDKVKTVLSQTSKYNLFELSVSMLIICPEYASEALEYLPGLPHLAVALLQAGHAQDNLIAESLLRCLNDRRWSTLCLDHLIRLLPSIDIVSLLETICLSSCISYHSVELRECILAMTEMSTSVTSIEISSEESLIYDSVGIFVDLHCTLQEAYKDRNKDAVLKYLQLTSMPDKAGFFSVERRISSPSQTPRRGDVFVFEAMQPPVNHPGYQCPPFVGVLYDVEDFVLIFDLHSAWLPHEVQDADWKAWNIGNLTTSRAMWNALTQQHISLGPQPHVDVSLSTTVSLNESQSEAIKMALSEKVSLIWGPPAVGKTFTVVRLLQELVLREERILVTASTHQAVDNILRKWIAQVPLDSELSEQILRLGDFEQVDKECRRWTAEMHPVMKDKRNPQHASRKLQKIISQGRVIFSTATGAGLGMLGRDEGFDTVLVDEAGQLTSANTRVATCKAKKRVVLIGDHKQLRATVHEESKKIGFEESLFEKLHERGYPCVMLDTQYRMHPSLIRFPSEQFYSGKIRSAESVQLFRPLGAFPWNEQEHLVCVDVVSGREKRDGTSFYNEEEARRISEWITKLVLKRECTPCQVGVITGYSAQVKCIKKLLARSSATKDVPVRTVDGFQGQEREAIFFSAVRTGHHVGFLKDQHRMNVMLTRAKRGLAIVGRVETLCIDPLWKKWKMEHRSSP